MTPSGRHFCNDVAAALREADFDSFASRLSIHGLDLDVLRPLRRCEVEPDDGTGRQSDRIHLIQGIHDDHSPFTRFELVRNLSKQICQQAAILGRFRGYAGIGQIVGCDQLGADIF